MLDLVYFFYLVFPGPLVPIRKGRMKSYLPNAQRANLLVPDNRPVRHFVRSLNNFCTIMHACFLHSCRFLLIVNFRFSSIISKLSIMSSVKDRIYLFSAIRRLSFARLSRGVSNLDAGHTLGPLE